MTVVGARQTRAERVILGQAGGIDTIFCIRVEAEQVVVHAAVGHAVIIAEEAAHRLDLGAGPVWLPEAFDGEVRRHFGFQIEHRNGQEGGAQFGARHAQRCYVQRRDGVDAELNEGAFAPVQRLVADAHIDFVAEQFGPGKEIGVQQAEIGADIAHRGAR